MPRTRSCSNLLVQLHFNMTHANHYNSRNKLANKDWNSQFYANCISFFNIKALEAQKETQKA